MVACVIHPLSKAKILQNYFVMKKGFPFFSPPFIDGNLKKPRTADNYEKKVRGRRMWLIVSATFSLQSELNTL